MMWDLDDLVAPSDIAEMFGTTKSAVSNWISRYGDFPPPLAIVSRGCTSLYSRQAVIEWRASW